jgi:hypothetical protein
MSAKVAVAVGISVLFLIVAVPVLYLLWQVWF